MEACISACAIYSCATCEYLATGDCPGCLEGNTRLGSAGEQGCAVFECVQSHGFESCKQCTEPSCVHKRSVEQICPVRSRFENVRWWAGRMSRALEARRPAESPESAASPIPARVINRLRLYLTALERLSDEGKRSVSSWQLAERIGINAALIRKDLSRFGDFGTPSFGYRVDFLSQRIRSILKLDRQRGLVWIGAACFALHEGALKRLESQGCRIAGVFDTEARVIGTQVGDHKVQPAEKLPDVLQGADIQVAALAVPGPEAKAIADILVRFGIGAILNMTGQLLVLPDSVRVCNLDPIGELLELCYYCHA